MTEILEINPVDTIRSEILEKLGHPKNVIKVDVKAIADNFYRVNVWTKIDEGLITAGKITHSEIIKFPAVLKQP